MRVELMDRGIVVGKNLQRQTIKKLATENGIQLLKVVSNINEDNKTCADLIEELEGKNFVF